MHLENGSVALEFLVVKGASFNVIICGPKMRSLQGKLDYGEYFARLKIGEKNIKLPMESDVCKYRFVKSVTDIEDFTSDSDIVSETSSEEEEEDK